VLTYIYQSSLLPFVVYSFLYCGLLLIPSIYVPAAWFCMQGRAFARKTAPRVTSAILLPSKNTVRFLSCRDCGTRAGCVPCALLYRYYRTGGTTAFTTTPPAPFPCTTCILLRVAFLPLATLPGRKVPSMPAPFLLHTPATPHCTPPSAVRLCTFRTNGQAGGGRPHIALHI